MGTHPLGRRSRPRFWGWYMLFVVSALLIAFAGRSRLGQCISIACVVTTSSPVPAQEVAVYLNPDVRAQLNAAWDSTNAKQHERGYCLQARKGLMPSGDSAWVVVRATRVVPKFDTPSSVDVWCRNMPILHVHPPTTCLWMPLLGHLYNTCVIGGEYAYQAWPSSPDSTLIAKYRPPFSIVQFDYDGFVVYYPRTP